MKTEIKGIGNFYGSLYVKKKKDKYFIKVSCEITKKEWREVSKELYDLLIELNLNHDTRRIIKTNN